MQLEYAQSPIMGSLRRKKAPSLSPSGSPLNLNIFSQKLNIIFGCFFNKDVQVISCPPVNLLLKPAALDSMAYSVCLQIFPYIKGKNK